MHSTHLLELSSLGQSVTYDVCCVIKVAASSTPLFVITPSLRGQTWFGDADDFYSKQSKLGEGGYGIVYKGWHVKRSAGEQGDGLVMSRWTAASLDAEMKEERAIKVFGLKERDTGSQGNLDAFKAWTHEKEQLAIAKLHAGPGADCLIKFYQKVRSAHPFAVPNPNCEPRHRSQEEGCEASGNQKRKTYLLPFERCKGQLHDHPLKSEWDLIDKQREQLRLLFVLLQSLHKKQVVHKDLDLANVMVCEDGSWRLIDFGIAKGATGGSAAFTETPRAGRKLSVPMPLALAWSDGRVGDGGTYQPKIQDDVASLGVVLHAFLAKRKHYVVGDKKSSLPEVPLRNPTAIPYVVEPEPGQTRNHYCHFSPCSGPQPRLVVAQRCSDMGLSVSGRC